MRGKEATHIEPLCAQWPILKTGSKVWAPFGERGWRAATITGIGKKRGYLTVVLLSFGTSGGRVVRLNSTGGSPNYRARTSQYQRLAH